MHCPSGTQLINSQDGVSKGTFLHDSQQCKPCQAAEYILDPDTDVCQTCPPGLICRGDDAVMNKMNVSTWMKSGSAYRLTSCPPGYSVSSVGLSGTFDATVQQCIPCPKGEECLSAPCNECNPCLPGFYKATVSIDSCTACPADTYNTNSGSQDVSACQLCQTHSSTQGLTAQVNITACVCDAQYYRFTATSTLICLPCPQGATCPDGSCALREASSLFCPGGESIVGSWKMDNISGHYQLIGCPDGFVLNFDQCQVCPASFYCSGGLSTSCASDRFSLPGASTSSSCFASVFVMVVINLPISRPLLASEKTVTFFQVSFARFANVRLEYILVDVIQAGKAGTDASTTDVTLKVATTGAKTAAALSRALTENSSTLNQDLNG